MSLLRLDRNGVAHIGNAHGKIAVYLNESEAIDLAHHYGPGDAAYDEIMEAVEVAYPKDVEDS